MTDKLNQILDKKVKSFNYIIYTINLITFQISDCFSPFKTFIFTTTKEPIYDAFKVMIDNNISSLPVYNDETEQFEKFIDISDIINHIVDIMLEVETF